MSFTPPVMPSGLTADNLRAWHTEYGLFTMVPPPCCPAPDEPPRTTPCPFDSHEHYVHPDILADEVAIAWTCRPTDIAWAREHLVWSRSGSRRPENLLPEWRVVAWAVSRRARHARRVWFIKPGDMDAYGTEDWPTEAVRPETIAVGSPSVEMGDPRGRDR